MKKPQTFTTTRTVTTTGTIISTWLQGKSNAARSQLLLKLGQNMSQLAHVPVDGIIEQFAAGLMAACADDLGLTPMELTCLLRTPRKDALAGLVTVLRNDA
jgi:hypothetical protein